MKIDVIYTKSSQRMDELPDESVDTILTSCPYWGLRDYGEDVSEIWGGDKDCEHSWNDATYVRNNDQTAGSKQRSNKGSAGRDEPVQNAFCSKCNAWHGQLGLEPTLEMYIEHLLLITLECKRVLKPTGVMWWNHGDSYYNASKWTYKETGHSWDRKKELVPRGRRQGKAGAMPEKCLALQNYRLVIRMIDEQGWILRNNAIWNKPNGMPSSVKDRLTNKYEPVFCLVKNTKPQYYWNKKTGLMADRKPPKEKQKEGIDWDWVAEEEYISKSGANIGDHNKEPYQKNNPHLLRLKKSPTEKKKKRSYWHSLGYWYDLDAIRETHKQSSLDRIAIGKEERRPSQTSEHIKGVGYKLGYKKLRLESKGKNPGDVWTIPTQPRPEAHFATFPDKLCVKPILATCPAEICRKCGKARIRIVKIKEHFTRPGHNSKFEVPQLSRQHDQERLKRRPVSEHQTIGWTDCGCKAGWDGGVLLDPFAGRGTSLIEAKKLGRHYVGYELKKEYCEKLIRPALKEIDPLFNWKTPSPAAG